MPGNPYRGVECFEREHAALYFRRERVARALLALTDEHALVALIGVAGSGKSSLVRAGLPEAHVVLPGEPLPMPGRERLLLVVDQFEGLLPDDPEIDRLLELAGSHVRVVLVVRAEAYAELLAHPGLARAVKPMTLRRWPAAICCRRSKSRRGAAGPRSRRASRSGSRPTPVPICGRSAPRCTRCGSATLRPAR